MSFTLLRRASAILGAVARLLVDCAATVVPDHCAGCNGELDRGFGLCGPLCTQCRDVLARPSGPRCAQCSLPLGSDRSERCLSCRDDSPTMTVLAPRPHEGLARDLLLRLKYRRRPALARELGRVTETDARVGAALDRAELIVPVPADPVRKHERGFDQAELLAHALSTAHRVRTGRRIRVRKVLGRQRGPAPQVALGRSARRRATRGRMRPAAFAARWVRGSTRGSRRRRRDDRRHGSGSAARHPASRSERRRGCRVLADRAAGDGRWAMNRKEFVERARERPFVGDGAMGTAIYARGIFINKCYDELCLARPELVVDIHREHVTAGAEIIETNSFGANWFRLARHGLEAKVEELNIAAAELARRAAGDDVLVAGSIGPTGVSLEPIGRTALTDARRAFRDQAQALVRGGVDLLVLETFGSLDELREAHRGAREAAPDLPIVACATFNDNGRTYVGTEATRIADVMSEEGADLLGANCSVGPAPLLDVLESMATVADGPFAVYPNAGNPEMVEGRLLYLCSPDYLGKYARRFVRVAPMGLLGGCCGTTADHVRNIRDAVRSQVSTSPELTPIALREEHAEGELEALPFRERSRLARKIDAGEFVTSVEINAPKGTQPAKALKAARLLKEGGVDVVNIPDGARATARMSNVALAVLIQEQVGLETLLHLCCRDRNLLGMQSDLIGAHALGLRNVLCVTGDPPRMGDYPEATAVFDVDSIGLVQLVNRLNRGLDAAGNAIGQRTEVMFGVGANPAAINLDEEIRRFEYKVDAGAEYPCMTQPVYDVAMLERFLERTHDCRIPTLVGILPLASHRNAEFLHEEVPGMSVPTEVRARMHEAGNGEEARKVGIAIAQEALLACRPLVQGAYIMPPLGRYRSALQVIEALS